MFSSTVDTFPASLRSSTRSASVQRAVEPQQALASTQGAKWPRCDLQAIAPADIASMYAHGWLVPRARVEIEGYAKTNFIPAAIHQDNAEDEDRAAVFEELQAFYSLRDGWDGPGSKAPSRDTVNEAVSFLNKALPQRLPMPDPTVDAEGEVGFFWRGANLYVDIGFKGKETISYYARIDGNVVKGCSAFHKHSALPKPLLEVLSIVRDRA